MACIGRTLYCTLEHYSFIRYSVWLTTGPKPLPKRFLHIVRSRASSFKWQYPLLSLRSSSSFLRLLPRLLVTSISLFIFPSITCFRSQSMNRSVFVMKAKSLRYEMLLHIDCLLCMILRLQTKPEIIQIFSLLWACWQRRNLKLPYNSKWVR
jgi:hypothetical protein